ncbi:LOW QUALITY PROTEIN: uncharacterized protein LOC144906481 [Branchiostoma floridae x Branchiostoma belcheri]
MSPAENKRAKRRRAKRTGTKLGRPTRPLAPRNTTATDEPLDLSTRGKEGDPMGQMPQTVFGQPLQLNAERCLLCRCERKDPVLPPASDGSTSGTSFDTQGLAQVPLWVCPDCRRSVEEEERKAALEPSLLPQDLFMPSSVPYLTPVPDLGAGAGLVTSSSEPTTPNGSGCNCEACKERREIAAEQERETQELQQCWTEVRHMVRCVYREAGTSLAAEESRELQMDTDKMKQLVGRLCSRDPHQLYQRLESQGREYVIEMKVRLLKQLTSGHKTPPQARQFIAMLLDEYSALCEAARLLTPALDEMEKGHLSKFQLTWEFVNKHLFHSIIYTDPLVQNSVPALITQLRLGAASKESYHEDTYPNVLHRYLKFDDEMTMVQMTWRDCQQLIDEYTEEQATLKAKQRMLKEDWEFFKAQRKLLEAQTKKKKSSHSGSSSSSSMEKATPSLTDTVRQLFSSGKTNSEECQCSHCKSKRYSTERCPCDECSLSHMLSAGIPDSDITEEFNFQPPPLPRDPLPDPLEDIRPPACPPRAPQAPSPHLLSPRIRTTPASTLHPSLLYEDAEDLSSQKGLLSMPLLFHGEGLADLHTPTLDGHDADYKWQKWEDFAYHNTGIINQDTLQWEDVKLSLTLNLEHGSKNASSENGVKGDSENDQQDDNEDSSSGSLSRKDSSASSCQASSVDKDEDDDGDDGDEEEEEDEDDDEEEVDEEEEDEDEDDDDDDDDGDMSEDQSDGEEEDEEEEKETTADVEKKADTLDVTNGVTPCECYVCLQGRLDAAQDAAAASITPHFPTDAASFPTTLEGLHLYPHIHGHSPLVPTHMGHSVRPLIHPHLYNLYAKQPRTKRHPFNLDLDTPEALHEHIYHAYGEWDTSYDSSKFMLGSSKYMGSFGTELLAPGDVPLFNGTGFAIDPALSQMNPPLADPIPLPLTTVPGVTSVSTSASEASTPASTAASSPQKAQDVAQSELTYDQPPPSLLDGCQKNKNVVPPYPPSTHHHNPPPGAFGMVNPPVSLPNLADNPYCFKHKPPMPLLPPSHPHPPTSSSTSTPPAKLTAEILRSAAVNAAIEEAARASGDQRVPTAPPSATGCQRNHLSAPAHKHHHPHSHPQPPTPAPRSCASSNALANIATSSNGCSDPDCLDGHSHGEDAPDDSCSEKSSSTVNSSNQKDGKYCDCCYCEFFGHGGPPVAPTSRNYTEMREKLRLRLTQRKQPKSEERPIPVSQPQCVKSQSSEKIDSRELEELLNFINGGEEEGSPKTSSRAAKRARRKQRKLAEEQARLEEEARQLELQRQKEEEERRQKEEQERLLQQQQQKNNKKKRKSKTSNSAVSGVNNKTSAGANSTGAEILQPNVKNPVASKSDKGQQNRVTQPPPPPPVGQETCQQNGSLKRKKRKAGNRSPSIPENRSSSESPQSDQRDRVKSEHAPRHLNHKIVPERPVNPKAPPPQEAANHKQLNGRATNNKLANGLAAQQKVVNGHVPNQKAINIKAAGQKLVNGQCANQKVVSNLEISQKGLNHGQAKRANCTVAVHRSARVQKSKNRPVGSSTTLPRPLRKRDRRNGVSEPPNKKQPGKHPPQVQPHDKQLPNKLKGNKPGKDGKTLDRALEERLKSEAPANHKAQRAQPLPRGKHPSPTPSPTGSESPTPQGKTSPNGTKNKKNKKKNKNASPMSVIDDIFMPKDEPETAELDDFEKELEAFKRFCMNSVPKEQKEKVHVNMKDIIIKGKSSAVHAH